MRRKSDFSDNTPNGENRVLLHCCCAPCSSAIVEWMLKKEIRPTMFYYNPNIYPLEEYEKRKNECVRYAKYLGLDIVDADYCNSEWKEKVVGMENEPERGSRCLTCFKCRLSKTAEYASTHGFTLIATTLGSSRWKDLDQIAEAGEYASSLYSGVFFWNQKWRRNGLSDRRNQIIKEMDFYNQQYCGCEYSFKH